MLQALGLVAWGTTIACANDLSNDKLDLISISSQIGATPTGWIVDAALSVSFPGGGYSDGASSEQFCNVLDPGGYGLFFKPFQGDVTNADLLSVQFYQDNPTTPGTKFTLSGYAAGEVNYSGFFATNNPAPKTLFVVQFLDAGNTVLQSNAFDLVAAGLTNGGPTTMKLMTTPQYTAPANTATVRAGAMMLNAYKTTDPQSFFVDVFDLESVLPPGSPVITNQPVQITVASNGTAVFTVGVSNTAGVSYQWKHSGIDLVNGGNISGATSQTLTITGVSTNDVGHYRVRVSNSLGTVLSKDATLATAGVSFLPGITIIGTINDQYRVDYATTADPNNFTTLSTNLLTMSPQVVIDTNSPGNRIYRVVFSP